MKKISRKIPVIMSSQHPDNAGAPYWHANPYIKTEDELKECFLMYKDLGVEEVMWDWEGKFVDEAVIERLYGTHLDFFRKKPLGKDIFLTFRVPNPRVESGYRLGRAYMVILSASHFVEGLGFKNKPLFEVILPMTETSAEIIKLQKGFESFSKVAEFSFGGNGFAKTPLEVIPLFETVGTIMQSGKILKKYVEAYKKQFGSYPIYLRPFCARSDPALNSGIVATTLAIKCALSDYADFSKETGITTFPIIAPGALPFRGGFTPETASEFADEFSGVKTVMIQSAFRYDYPLPVVKNAIRLLQKNLPFSQTRAVSESTHKKVQKIIPWFEVPYAKTVEKIAPIIEKISVHIPKRRERLQHIGLFGYSRGIGKVKLPRAIGFSASCYSLGIPPELFGVGEGLSRAKKEGEIEIIESLYRTLKPALKRAGRYLRIESLRELGLSELEKGIIAIEEYLGEKLGPVTKEEFRHAELVKKIIVMMKEGKSPIKEIEQAAIIRKSLG